MADKVFEGTSTTQQLSEKIVASFPGKSIGGHPFFEVDLPGLIAAEVHANRDNSDLSEEEKKEIQDRLLAGYAHLDKPCYDVNNSVYLLIEPDEGKEVGYRAYMTAFPSEEAFQKLRAINPNFQRFSTGQEYQSHIDKLFIIPQSYHSDSLLHIPSWEREGKYLKGGYHVPLSDSVYLDGSIKTPIQDMIDRMIDQLSSPVA